jgi:hypothetical protein
MNRRSLWTATLSLLLAMAVAAALAGCDGGKTPSGSHSSTSSTQTKPPSRPGKY